MLQSVHQSDGSTFRVHATPNLNPSTIFNLLGRKWRPEALLALATPRRFNELREALRPISAKILTDSLEHLALHGLVTRVQVEEPTARRPFRIEYRQTQKGGEVARIVSTMVELERRWTGETQAGLPQVVQGAATEPQGYG